MSYLSKLKPGVDYLSSRDASEAYKVTNDYLARLCRQGKLRGVLDGRTWYIEAASLWEFFGTGGNAAISAVEGGRIFYKPAVEPTAPQSGSIARTLAPSRNRAITTVCPPEARPHISARNVKASLGAAKTAVRALTLAVLFVAAFGLASGTMLNHRPQLAQHAEQQFAAAGSLGDFLSGFSRTARTVASVIDSVTYEILFGRPTAVVVPAVVAAKPSSAAPESDQKPRVVQSAPSTIINNPVHTERIERVVERIVETQRVVHEGSVSEEYVNQNVLALENKLRSLVLASTASSVASNAATYQVVAQTNRIDSLDDVDLSSPAITGGTITNATISDSTFSTASFSGTTTLSALALGSSTTTASNGFNISDGCFAINGTCLSTGGSSASSTLLQSDTNTFTNLTTFTGGLRAFASSTIGGGTAITGLTISGGATTTGNQYVIGNLSLDGTLNFSATATSTLALFQGAPFILASTTNKNLFVGYQSGANTVAAQQSCDGYTSGSTGFGYQALAVQTTGCANTAIGSSALGSNVSGTESVAVGHNALATATSTENFSVAVGTGAMELSKRGQQNTAIGYLSMNALGNSSGGFASDNVAVGAYSMQNGGADAYANVGIGANALQRVTGIGNIGIGWSSLNSSGFSGGNNVAIGYQAGKGITTGFGNILLGGSETTGNLTIGGGNVALANNPFFASSAANNQLNIGGLIFGSLPATSTGWLLPTSGTIGIGTTSPTSRFGIALNNGGTLTTAFQISSSTASATSTLFAVSNTGSTTIYSLLNVGSGTSTFAGGVNMSALNITGATSTTANGFNIASGCYAMNGTCLSAGSSASSTLLQSDTNTFTNLTTFTGGLRAFASSTIGGGTAITGLTISGGATTTGNLLVQGSATSTAFFATTASSTNLFSNAATIGALTGGTGSFSSTLGVTGLSTLTGGLASYASSTIGAGGATTGLTISGGATTTGTAYFASNLGVATSSPFRALSITGAVATAQQALSYDAGNNTDLLTSSTGDYFVYPSGKDALINDSNLWVCTGGTGNTNGCPSGSPSGQGNLIVETRIGLASSTPVAAFSIGPDGSVLTTEKVLSDAGTITISWLDGNQQVVTLGGNRTIAFSNYANPGGTLRLVLCQDATGSRTITWPNGSVLLWAGGTAPTLTTTANKCDVMTFLSTSGTSTVKVLGSSVLSF